MGLTMGKDVLGQAECREDGGTAAECSGARGLALSSARDADSEFSGAPQPPARAPSGGKFRDIANEMCGK